MPLSKIQTDVLRLLASHRDPEGYVAWATPLNRDAARYSDDIDVFHDREERVAAAALHDAQALKEAGYRVSWLRQLPLIYTAEVISEGRWHPARNKTTHGIAKWPVEQITKRSHFPPNPNKMKPLAPTTAKPKFPAKPR